MTDRENLYHRKLGGGTIKKKPGGLKKRGSTKTITGEGISKRNTGKRPIDTHSEKEIDFYAINKGV